MSRLNLLALLFLVFGCVKQSTPMPTPEPVLTLLSQTVSPPVQNAAIQISATPSPTLPPINPPIVKTSININDTTCYWNRVETIYVDHYECQDDINDPLFLIGVKSKEILNKKFLLFKRNKKSDEKYNEYDGYLRGAIQTVTLADQTDCTLTVNRADYNPFQYSCPNGHIVTRLFDDAKGYWQAQLNNEKTWFPVYAITIEFDPNEPHTYPEALVGKSETELTWELLDDGYERSWTEEIVTDEFTYRTFVFNQTLSQSYYDQLFVVFAGKTGNTLSVSANATIADYNIEVLSGNWHDLNDDGFLELAIRKIHTGNNGVLPVTILQLHEGSVRKLNPELEEHHWPANVFDLNNDGISELLVYDRTYQLMGGCSVCGFSVPLIYAWDGNEYVESSGQFEGYYWSKIAVLIKQANTSFYTPQSLLELLILSTLIGEQEIGWEIFSQKWKHEEWEDYAPYYDEFARDYEAD